jgi:hypothetical protein
VLQRKNKNNKIASFLLSLLEDRSTTATREFPIDDPNSGSSSEAGNATEAERLMELITMQNAEMSKLRVLLAEKDAKIAELEIEKEALRRHAESAETTLLKVEKQAALNRYRDLRKFPSDRQQL